FSLDDFGTGYSTLDHLRRVPARTLKIDRTFIRDMLDDTEDRALVEAIIALGRSFRRDVVAVGVERVEQVRWLLAAGCDLMQGFYIAPPLPADAFMEWLEAFRADPAWTAP
ncbi:MAG: EAL domain-containing protein, partial [Gammaproteobacteria bacterium]|nr:EAL domain-containing protein [Gammaproteobacteria bacterium]